MKKIILFLSVPFTLVFDSYGQVYTPSGVIQGATTGSLSSTALGVGTNAPDALMHVYNGCVLFDGTTGATPVSGAGARFMWIPEKRAFRAGEVTGSHWDNANIGMWSGAGGANTRAECEGCFAWGTGAFAANDPMAGANEACISLGNGTTASGHVSVAIGDQTIATGEGGATAIGVYTQATGLSSIAIGQNNTASGKRSIALGELAISSGEKSVAIGQNAAASALSSLSLSTQEATASGDYSIAMGGLANNNGHTGSFVYADHDPSYSLPWVENNADYQFLARARGGFVFHSDGNLNTTDALYFNGGNLGVGVDAPTAKTDIDGKLRVRDIPQDDNLTEILVKDGDGVIHYRDFSTIAGGAWLTTANNIPTTINDDIYKQGNVGIGTNSLAGRLHVVNPACSGTPGMLVAAEPTAVLCAPGTQHGPLFRADGYLNSASGTVVPKVVISATGWVGIGTATPKLELDLHKGDMLFSGGASNSFRFHNQYWLPNGQLFLSPADANGNITATGLAMSNFGNIGIGTNSHPLHKLQVAGNIVPAAGCSYNLGASGQAWYTAYFCVAPTVSSDRRLKNNIQDLEYGIDMIQKLRPVTYVLNKGDDNSERIGLIAQEVKEILPEIVRVGDDPEKTMGIIYTELIPVLIQGMKEQQAMITELQTKLELYKNEKAATVKDGETNKILDGVILYQNSPNPFDRSTEIRYYIPERIKTANIMIFDLNGKQLKNFTIDTRGDGGISLEAGIWVPGMYLYSLTVDGVIADTKRMILSGN